MGRQWKNPGMSTVVLNVSWDNWDVHSCPECKLGKLGPGIEWAGGESSTVVLSVSWDN